jgi:hypothetical protein
MLADFLVMLFNITYRPKPVCRMWRVARLNVDHHLLISSEMPKMKIRMEIGNSKETGM